ncbi:MAG: metallophosphatase family protein [Lachnospiraceae bacterium]|nr:metallophosphatase family protein [Lachnospiraceae bacterium]
MKLAVLSDIHGNYVALEKCLEYCRKEGITTYLFLGDYLGDLAYPQKTMSILYDWMERYECYFIRGNKEEYWFRYNPRWKGYSSTTGCLYYNYHQLTGRDMEFFRTLPIARPLRFPDCPPITICHGSPVNVKQQMLPDLDATYDVMEQDENDYIFCGHTHRQGEIHSSSKYLWNPGSVGVSIDAGGKAQFMIAECYGKGWAPTFLSLDYDVKRVEEDLKEAGLDALAPAWTAVSIHMLYGGSHSHATVLSRSMELCKQEEGECNWPDIPEKYWQKAITELGIAAV